MRRVHRAELHKQAMLLGLFTLGKSHKEAFMDWTDRAADASADEYAYHGATVFLKHFLRYIKKNY